MDTFKFSFFDDEITDEKPTEPTAPEAPSSSEAPASDDSSDTSATPKSRPAPMPVLGFADDSEDDNEEDFSLPIAPRANPSTLFPASPEPVPSSLDLTPPADNFDFSLDVPSTTGDTTPPETSSAPDSSEETLASPDPFDFPLEFPEAETISSSSEAPASPAEEEISDDPFNFAFEVAEELEELGAESTAEDTSPEHTTLEPIAETAAPETEVEDVEPFDFSLDTPENGAPIPDPLAFTLNGTTPIASPTPQGELAFDLPDLTDIPKTDASPASNQTAPDLEDAPSLEQTSEEDEIDPFSEFTLRGNGMDADSLEFADLPEVEETDPLSDLRSLDDLTAEDASMQAVLEAIPILKTASLSANDSPDDEASSQQDVADVEGSASAEFAPDFNLDSPAFEESVEVREVLPLETPFVALPHHETEENVEAIAVPETVNTVAEADSTETEPVELETAEAAPVVDEPVAEVTAAVMAPEPAVEETPLEDASLFALPLENPLEDGSEERPYTPPRPALRVAVLGASGVGRHHARWLTRHGCKVVSFLGSSNTSIVATEESLRESIGFTGQGYDSLDQLLTESSPEAVVIASPPQLHFAQALQCLENGLHVLCEKPLVYAPTRNVRENIAGAKELVKTATKKKLVFGTQLQYAGATPILCKLAGTTMFDVGDFAMEMETSNPKSPRDPKELWIDLGPHPLSVAQKLAGDNAKLAEETIQIMPQIAESHTALSVRFGIECQDGRLLIVRAILRAFDANVESRAPRRRFAFNGRVVQYNREARTNRAQYTAPDGYDSIYDDPVDYLIGNFVQACAGESELLVSGALGLQNLEWLLKIGEKLD